MAKKKKKIVLNVRNALYFTIQKQFLKFTSSFGKWAVNHSSQPQNTLKFYIYKRLFDDYNA